MYLKHCKNVGSWIHELDFLRLRGYFFDYAREFLENKNILKNQRNICTIADNFGTTADNFGTSQKFMEDHYFVSYPAQL
jgi:hypothetical protein